jgi:hypothetical protein
MACVHYLSMLVRNQYIRQGLHKDYLHFIVDSQLQQAAQRRSLASGLNYATQQYMQTNPYMMMLETEQPTSPNPMTVAGRRRLLTNMRSMVTADSGSGSGSGSSAGSGSGSAAASGGGSSNGAPPEKKADAVKLNKEEEKQKAVVRGQMSLLPCAPRDGRRQWLAPWNEALCRVSCWERCITPIRPGRVFNQTRPCAESALRRRLGWAHF